MKIEIEIPSTNPIDDNAKKQAIQQIAKLDVDTLGKLSELSKSEKAVKSLSTNWGYVKTFLM